MLNENVEINSNEDSAMKTMLDIIKENNTCDSSRTHYKPKRSPSQKRHVKEDCKKRVCFKAPLCEFVNVESFKLWTKKMYILPSHDGKRNEGESCCEEKLCTIY
jgi:hypothetical protein